MVLRELVLIEERPQDLLGNVTEIFIYSGALASVPTDDLLEDMATANRYEQWDMKEERESEISVVPQNAVKVLQAAISVSALSSEVEGSSHSSDHSKSW